MSNMRIHTMPASRLRHPKNDCKGFIFIYNNFGFLNLLIIKNLGKFWRPSEIFGDFDVHLDVYVLVFSRKFTLAAKSLAQRVHGELNSTKK